MTKVCYGLMVCVIHTVTLPTLMEKWKKYFKHRRRRQGDAGGTAPPPPPPQKKKNISICKNVRFRANFGRLFFFFFLVNYFCRAGITCIPNLMLKYRTDFGGGEKTRSAQLSRSARCSALPAGTSANGFFRQNGSASTAWNLDSFLSSQISLDFDQIPWIRVLTQFLCLV